MTVPAPEETLSPNGISPVAAQDPDDDLFEPDWNRPKRTNKLTFVLLAALVAALAFAGGVAVQKQHDAGLTATAGRARGAGGFGGAAGVGGTGGGTTGQEAGGGPAATGGTPVAIGTVKSISGTTVTITNFAGTAVTVTVPPTATVTTPGLGGLAVGATVSVAGTTNSDGTVTATSITSRRTA